MNAVRRGRSLVLVALLGAVAALASLGLHALASGSVGPGKVAVSARFGSGRTELRLPPLGQMSAATHWSPVTLEAQVEQVDVDQLQRLLSREAPADRLRQEVSRDLTPLVRSFALHALLAAAVAGGLVGALVRRRRWIHGLVGATSGVLAVGLLLGGAWWSYDGDAWEEARFEGPLERAPGLLATVRRHVDGFEDVRQRFEVLGGQVAELYAATSAGTAAAVGADDEVRILHVSDLHSNPLGFEVTRQLADRFNVDAVLDTGDVTSFGLPVESRVGELIGKIPARYLLVPGNHDSSENRAALDGVGNVELLDGNVAEVKGIRILGVGDPTFTATNETGSREAAAIKRATRADVAGITALAAPDVLAVHDPSQAVGAYGKVPLVVAGHVHRGSTTRHGQTLVLTVGSTGATGLGSFLVESDRGYEAQVLRFVHGHLVSVDRIAFSGVGGAFEVERSLMPQLEGRPQVAGGGNGRLSAEVKEP